MNRLFDKIPILGKKVPGKITLSFLMLIFAICMLLTFKTFDRMTCLVAMIFSFVGDVFLNHTKDHSKQSTKDFILGGSSFILAHMFYLVTYNYKIREDNYTLINLGFKCAIIILLIITILMLKLSKSNNHISMLTFGICYIWLTGINYMFIFSYSYSSCSLKSLAALGGLMFLISDVIIGFEKFAGLKSKLARELVWWLYPIGQIIIIAMA